MQRRNLLKVPVIGSFTLDITPFWTNLFSIFHTLSALRQPWKRCYMGLSHLPIGQGLISRWLIHVRVSYTVIDTN